MLNSSFIYLTEKHRFDLLEQLKRNIERILDYLKKQGVKAKRSGG